MGKKGEKGEGNPKRRADREALRATLPEKEREYNASRCVEIREVKKKGTKGLPQEKQGEAWKQLKTFSSFQEADNTRKSRPGDVKVRKLPSGMFAVLIR